MLVCDKCRWGCEGREDDAEDQVDAWRIYSPVVIGERPGFGVRANGSGIRPGR